MKRILIVLAVIVLAGACSSGDAFDDAVVESVRSTGYYDGEPDDKITADLTAVCLQTSVYGDGGAFITWEFLALEDEPRDAERLYAAVTALGNARWCPIDAQNDVMADALIVMRAYQES